MTSKSSVCWGLAGAIKTSKVFLYLIIGSVTLVDPLFAEIHAVSRSRRNHVMAINEAIESANVGDTVFLDEGFWDIKETAIKARSGVSIKGVGRLTIIRHLSESNEHPIIDIQDTTNVTISNLTLNGMNNPLCTHGIDGSNVERLTVRAISVFDLVPSSEFGTFGVFLNSNANDCTISDCEFVNIGVDSNWGAAIQVSQLPNVPPSRNINASRNHIVNTGRGGVLMQNTLHATVTDNVIQSSGMAGEEGLAIELFDKCNFGIIENNSVDHWISVDSAEFISIRDNFVADDSGSLQLAGIEIAGESANCVVTGNHTLGGNQIGFSMSNDGVKDNFLIARNTFEASGAACAQIQGDQGGAKRLYVYKNVFKNATQNPETIIPNGGIGFRINGNVSQVVFDDNDVDSNEGDGIQITTDDDILNPVDRLTFRNNTVSGNGGDGVTEAATLKKDLSSLENITWAEDNIVFENGGNEFPESGGFEGNREPRVRIRARRAARVGVPFRLRAIVSDDDQVVQLLWDLGEGNPANITNPVITYQTPGIKRVRLVAWDNEGQATIFERSIRVRRGRRAVP